MKRFWAVALLCAWAVSATAAVVLVNDTFSGGTRGDDAGEALDVAWRSDGTAALAVAPDAVLGGGNALFVSNTAPLIAPLAQPFTLANVGDWVSLSFDYRLQVADTANSNTNPRFGLYNSNGTAVLSDATASNSRNDNGYHAAWRTANSASTWNVLNKELGDGAPFILGGTLDIAALATSSSGWLDRTDTGKHHFELILTRTGPAALSLSVWLDGILYGSATDSSAPIFTFDEIAFRSGTATGAVLDNVLLVLTIPEPATATLLVLAAAALRPRRRRG